MCHHHVYYIYGTRNCNGEKGTRNVYVSICLFRYHWVCAAFICWPINILYRKAPKVLISWHTKHLRYRRQDKWIHSICITTMCTELLE